MEPVLPPPRLRGWSHAVSFPVMVVAGTVLVLAARTSPSGRAALAVYAGGTAAMFGVSALYHRIPWRPHSKLLMQRFDRSAIFLAIAGGYTPVAWACLEGTARWAVLAMVWSAALAGAVLHWFPAVPRTVKGASYIVVSWLAVIGLPRVLHRIGPAGLALIVAGGIAYTVGAACLALRRPNPWPGVFGFHEVFHAFTIVAAGLQFAAIASFVVPRL